MKRGIAVCALCAALGAAVCAAAKTVRKPDFAKMDRNKDGKVDADEFDAYIVAFPEFNLNRGVFRAWDADGDGAVTRDEFDAWRPARKGAKEAGGEE